MEVMIRFAKNEQVWRIEQSGRVVYFYEEPQVLKNIRGILVGGLLVPHINKWDLESGFRSGSSSSSS